MAFQLSFNRLSLIQGIVSISWKAMSHSDCVIQAESASSLKGGSCVSGHSSITRVMIIGKFSEQLTSINYHLEINFDT